MPKRKTRVYDQVKHAACVLCCVRGWHPFCQAVDAAAVDYDYRFQADRRDRISRVAVLLLNEPNMLADFSIPQALRLATKLMKEINSAQA